MRWLVAAIVLLSGCETKPAAVVVVLESDLEIGAEIDAIQVAVEEDGGALLATHDLPLDAHTLPASFGIVRDGHSGEDGSLDIAVAVEGERFRATAVAQRDDEALFATFAITGFREGFITQLTLVLSRNCLETLCGPDQTCRADGCVAPELDPTSLSEWR